MAVLYDSKSLDDVAIGLGFSFMVEIDGSVQGIFTECGGLTATISVEKWEEGGLNTHAHQFPGRMSYDNISLKQAVFASTDLYDWFLEVARGELARKPISIILADSEGSEVRRWDFSDAFPVKWSGPALNVTSNDAAIETLEFAHAGLIPSG